MLVSLLPRTLKGDKTSFIYSKVCFDQFKSSCGHSKEFSQRRTNGRRITKEICKMDVSCDAGRGRLSCATNLPLVKL